ncbi:hypothetical protein GCM10027290_29000 [Micromonospora sonneratiae]|uniref:Uncharacterized protein n=1 Tax=Micromonospora sonneratiae TaxID=1184706 RepID=A0ABW3Y7C4_9ACTN
MGRKTVHVSDFSGKVLQPDDAVVRVVVLEHPDLVAGPVQLEARPIEIESIDDAALDVAVVEIYDSHGGGEPRRVTLTASEFDTLATDVPMAQLLRTAERIRPPKATRKAAEKLDYATLEHAGKPHRGKITDEEAQLVRDNLDEINKRLADEGIRQIDPTDPDHASRYGFPLSDESTD